MTVSSSVYLLATLLLLVALCNIDTVASFLLENPLRSPTYAVAQANVGTPSSCTLKLGASTDSETSDELDDYDDFYADFDPSDYEDYGPTNQDTYGDKYTRDIDADNSDVDLDTVSELLARRTEMKMTRQFDEADKIQDDLLRIHGVLVRDKDRKWRTGCIEGENYQKWLRGGNFNNQRGNFKNRDDFGPNGHDYVLAKDAGPNISSLSEETIHELLAKRLSFKFERDFDAADAIQAELLSAGVVINGKGKEWRADGKFFSGYAPREYKMLPHDYDISSNVKEIERLIEERALARAERLFKRSDEIREELFQKFDVRINDKKQLWSVGADQSWDETYEPYRLSERSEVPSDMDDIEKLVEERDRARGERDFARADAIRDQLLKKNVVIDDKQRKWYIGKFSRSQGKGKSNDQEYSPYIRRGGGDVSVEEQTEIESLIKERDGHKRKRQYNEADAIRDILLNKHGVQVDDTNRQWHIFSAEYCLAHDSAEIDDKTREMVQKKVQDRMLARGEQDWKKADTIKKVLFKKHNVVIDDRLKEWSVVKRNN